MALVTISVSVTDTKQKAFEAFLKTLIGPQSPVPGDRLFSLAMTTKAQRDKNMQRHKDDAAILKKARAQGLTAG